MHFSSLFLKTAPQYLSNEGSTIFIVFFVTEILQFQVLPYILQILANLRQRSHEKVLRQLIIRKIVINLIFSNS